AAGGVLYALNYGEINPLMGVMPGLKSFVAAVLGGIGIVPGAMLGGLLIGLCDEFVVYFGLPSSYQSAITFTILILVLLFRPAGLLGKHAPEKVCPSPGFSPSAVRSAWRSSSSSPSGTTAPPSPARGSPPPGPAGS